MTEADKVHEGIREALAAIDKLKRIVLAPPELVDRVQAVVDASPTPGLWEVRASPFAPKGSVIVLGPNLLEAS
jgi:hypothetical protein